MENQIEAAHQTYTAAQSSQKQVNVQMVDNFQDIRQGLELLHQALRESKLEDLLREQQSATQAAQTHLETKFNDVEKMIREQMLMGSQSHPYFTGAGRYIAS